MALNSNVMMLQIELNEEEKRTNILHLLGQQMFEFRGVGEIVVVVGDGAPPLLLLPCTAPALHPWSWWLEVHL